MTSPDQVSASVLEGSADLGVTALIRRTVALIGDPVCRERIGTFCYRDHPLFLRNDAGLTVEELSGHHFVATEVTQKADYSDLVGAFVPSAAAPTILSRIRLLAAGLCRPLGRTKDIREPCLRGSRGADMCYVIHRPARPLGLGGRSFAA